MWWRRPKHQQTDPLRRAADLWREHGVDIRPGVAPAEIQAFEERFGVVLPADLRRYFLFVDGMNDGDWDDLMNRFWPLAELKPVSEELEDVNPDRWAYPGCFAFADHCIWCFGWAVRLDNCPREVSGPIYLVTGSDPPGTEIARSFSEFMEMYLESRANIM